MRIGIFVSTGRGAPLERILADFRSAEQHGLHTAWVGQLFEVDALTLLALAGRETQQIELGSWVVPIQRSHPAALAQQALSVQLACGGRLLLGVGISHAAVVEKRLGLAYAAPERAMREYLAELQPLLRGEARALPGARSPLRLEFEGVRAPALFLAALGPRMLALAGREADGIALWLGGQRFLRDYALPLVSEAAAAAGRPLPRIVCALPVIVTRDVAAGRAAARALVLQSSRLPAYQRVLAREAAAAPEDTAIVGDASSVIAQIQALCRLGASDFHAIPVPFEGDAGREALLAALAELARPGASD